MRSLGCSVGLLSFVLLLSCLEAASCSLCEVGKSNPCECEVVGPGGGSCPADEKYFEGYLQGLIETNYYNGCVVVKVRDGTIYLYNLPENDLIAHSIVEFVKNVPCACKVVVVPCEAEEKTECEVNCSLINSPYRRQGIWLPQQVILFNPLLADPRQTMYSGAYRLGDKVIGRHAAAVSFGEDFPIYQWRNLWGTCGDMQVGIEGCVFTVFSFDTPSPELVNADYFVSLPFTYARGKWSYRARIWHVSSHVGDEYLCDHPGFVRKNAAREVVDFFASYQMNRHIRFYGGVGYAFHVDHSFPLKRPYVQYGAEFFFWEKRDKYNLLYRQPYFAVNVQNAAYNHWDFDATASLGIEWSKIPNVGRKVRISLDYHKGFCPDGQFCKMRDFYFDLKLSYGF